MGQDIERRVETIGRKKTTDSILFGVHLQRTVTLYEETDFSSLCGACFTFIGVHPCRAIPRFTMPRFCDGIFPKAIFRYITHITHALIDRRGFFCQSRHCFCRQSPLVEADVVHITAIIGFCRTEVIHVTCIRRTTENLTDLQTTCREAHPILRQ